MSLVIRNKNRVIPIRKKPIFFLQERNLLMTFLPQIRYIPGLLILNKLFLYAKYSKINEYLRSLPQFNINQAKKPAQRLTFDCCDKEFF